MKTLDTFSYIDWSAKILNEHLKTQPKWLATCNKVTTVYHFSWSALSCQQCGSMVNKYDWWTL